jgi:hypothetical protein
VRWEVRQTGEARILCAYSLDVAKRGEVQDGGDGEESALSIVEGPAFDMASNVRLTLQAMLCSGGARRDQYGHGVEDEADSKC